MDRRVIAFIVIALSCGMASAVDVYSDAVAAQAAVAFQQSEKDRNESQSDEEFVRQAVASYVESFNKHDAAAVAERWSPNAVCVDEETGERTEGRDALKQRFAAFFDAHPGAHLSGRLDAVRFIRPDVAQADGVATLVTGEEVIDSAYSAILVRSGDSWLIDSSHERDLPRRAAAHELRDFEWLIGTWEDQSEGVHVTTTIRWSPNRGFLLRSFRADYGVGPAMEGTQVIGWDPLNRQVRTWTFHSDGSFAEGTASRNDDSWMVKMTHVLSDGRLAEGTQVITRVDDDTITVKTIGQTVNGEPVPASDPVTVVRTGHGDADFSTDAAASDGGTR